MEALESRHFDCRNFAAVDVVKGICHRTKQMVLADGASCEKCTPLPRCGCCERYAPSDRASMGVCRATAADRMTYPELSGALCDGFTWKKR
jgi:4-hydroxyphenylacetate decarboxylase small subunit